MKKKDIIKLVKESVQEVKSDAYGSATLTSQGQSIHRAPGVWENKEELADLQARLDQLYREMEQEAEPEGGPIADQYADQMHDIEQAMQIKRGKTKDVPYDVAIGRMTQDEYDRAIGLKEGTCGYSIDGKPANKPAGPYLLRKAIRKEIRSLNEEKGDKGFQTARKLIAKLREKTYRSFSDEDLDAFSKEMVLHFIDNPAAEAAVMMRSAKSKSLYSDDELDKTDNLPF